MGSTFVNAKKGQAEFAMAVIQGNVRGRTLALYGVNEETLPALKKIGIADYRIVTDQKDKVKGRIGDLADLQGRAEQYYVISDLERDAKNVKKLQDLGFTEYRDFYFLRDSQRLVSHLLWNEINAEDTIDIMTSCDSNLLPYILVQLQELHENMPGRHIRYYIFHSKASSGDVEALRKKAKVYRNMELFGIEMPNETIYEEISNLCNPNGWWKKEALYHICAYKYLPETLDRVLYVDAGDVMVTGCLDPFYFSDFQDMPIRATLGRYKALDERGKIIPYEKEDLYRGDIGMVQQILMGVFNSGAFMMNLEKMREIRYSENDYLDFIKKICQLYGKDRVCFKFTDQALLSAVFLGRIQYYKLDEFNDFWFRPYNFCLYYYDEPRASAPYYSPAIVHFAGFHTPKPWRVDFPYLTKHTCMEPARFQSSGLNPGMRSYYHQWGAYFIKAQLTTDEQAYLESMVSSKEMDRKKRQQGLLRFYTAQMERVHHVPFDSVYHPKLNYALFPISKDGRLHYEFLMVQDTLRICLHFEGTWKKYEEAIQEAMEKCDGLEHKVMRDELGIYYSADDIYDVDTVVYLARHLMSVTYPVLLKRGMIPDKVRLRQAVECPWMYCSD